MSYGWFSEKHSEIIGAELYSCPKTEKHNGIALLTYVSRDSNGDDYDWDDKIYVGKVWNYMPSHEIRPIGMMKNLK